MNLPLEKLYESDMLREESELNLVILYDEKGQKFREYTCGDYLTIHCICDESDDEEEKKAKSGKDAPKYPLIKYYTRYEL